MSKSYAPIQTFEAKRLSIDLLDNPEEFYMHNRRYSASVIMTVVYGRPIPKCIPFSFPFLSLPFLLGIGVFFPSILEIAYVLGDSIDVQKIYSILTRFASFRRPGAWLVDVIPELANSRLFDMISPWKKVADEIFK